MKKFFSLVLALVMALSLTTIAWGAATEVATADALLNATKAGVAEVKLTADITLPAGQHVPVVADLVVDGNGYSITFTPGTGLFNNLNGVYGPGPEGITDNLTVKNLTMISTTGGGHAVVTKNVVGGFDVSFTNCRFENLYCGVLLNGNVVQDPANVAPSVTVSGSTFEDTEYGVSFVTEDCVDEVSFENNTMTGETSIQEVFTNPAYLTAPTVKVSSGTFSTDVTAYLASTAGFVTNPDGSVTVGAKAATGTYDLHACSAPAVAAATGLSYTKVAAAQSTDGTGTIAYVSVDNGKNYVVISSFEATKGDFYLTNAGSDAAVMYLREVAVVSYTASAAEYTNFGYACGQYTKQYGDTKEYYQVLTGADKGKVYAEGTGGAAVLVGDEVVELAATPVTLNAHVWSATAVDNTTGVPTAAICGKCSTRGTVYASVAKVPAAAIVDVTALTYNNNTYPVVAGVKAVVGGTTGPIVESAETFDAGIAMYVGMSVMAAAGSAVVIGKKKD